MASRGYTIKGLTGRISHVEAKPGIIGKKRLENLEKAFKNRERRAKYWAKKLNYKDEDTGKFIRKLSQKQFLPPQLQIDFRKVKTVKDYNELMRQVNEDKTSLFKEGRTDAMRNWLSTAIEETLNEEDDKDIINVINKMSASDIAAFALKYRHLIAKIFEYYEKVKIPDMEERDQLRNSIRWALGLPFDEDYVDPTLVPYKGPVVLYT